MRVLLPITLDRWRHSIATALRETCIRISDVSFYSFSDPLSEEDRVLGEIVWAHPHLYRIQTLDAFRDTFDVVHHASATNRNLTASLGARVRSLGGCRHLFSAQVEPFKDDPWYWHYRFAIHTAHRLTAVSKVVADSVKKHFGRSVDAIIPNGVDLTFFSREAAHEINLGNLGFGKPYVVFAAHLEPRKRPDIFVEISKLLPEVDFVMLGGYSNRAERDRYLALVRHRPNVHYLGLQPRTVLRDLYAHAGALIFPSEIEGLALSVIEAQAMGLPVLAQPKTCMPELIEIGTTGWMLPVSDLKAWAGKITEVLAWSCSESERYRTKSRAVTEKKYSWDVIAPLYREMYLATANS